MKYNELRKELRNYYGKTSYETRIIPGFSDGARDYHGSKHIGGWTYWRNYHKFIEQDKEL